MDGHWPRARKIPHRPPPDEELIKVYTRQANRARQDEITTEISEIVEYRGQFNERPVTSTRSATTQVEVRSGETVMIGGLIRSIDTKVERKVPILGDIPILNYLFRHKATTKQKVDLMIFITPHLLGE